MHHTVLVVGDGRRLQPGLREALGQEPFAVLAADDAGAALRALASTPVDVVIADEGLPGTSGSELLDGLQATHPGTVRMLLADPSGSEAAIRAVGAGRLYRFFLKPCHAVDVAATVRQALHQRDLLQESRRLLQTVRRQSLVMEELEREIHGLRRIARDPVAAVALSDVPTDPDVLLRELQSELTLTDQRLRTQERELRRRSGSR